MSIEPKTSFSPPYGLRNPHLQTILSSVARRQFVPEAIQHFLSGGESRVFEVENVALKVDLHIQPGRPLITMIPGWLGSSESAYVRSMGQFLYQQGFSIARINLRDHGDTEHLNEGLFNSALIDEVVALVSQLNLELSEHAKNGLVGFSLGGNFALRVVKQLPQLRCLAICPAIAPANTMYKIDSNPIYQKYFVRKWRKTWAAKQAAYPGAFDFEAALQLNTVSALTDYFVRYHSAFSSTDEYFDAYDLSGAYLDGVQAHVLAAHDDPVVPASQWLALPDSVEVVLTNSGGHGAYLSNWRLESWADAYAANYFAELL